MLSSVFPKPAGGWQGVGLERSMCRLKEAGLAVLGGDAPACQADVRGVFAVEIPHNELVSIQ